MVGGLRICAALVCHPGPTVGYRISEDGATVAYIPDHEPLLGAARLPSSDWISGFDLAAHADLLIHDSQYSATQYPKHVGWGHSAIPHVNTSIPSANSRRERVPEARRPTHC